MSSCTMFGIESLVEDNAKSARQLLGVPVLTNTQEGDGGAFQVRRNALWRSLYPRDAPVSAEAAVIAAREEEANSNGNQGSSGNATAVSSALITVRKDAHQQTTSAMIASSGPSSSTLLGKRTREEEQNGETDVIRADPRQLKAKHSLVVSSAAAAEAAQQAYNPPAKWKISKVLVGHQGWVWTAAVDPTNSWFATGGFDSVIKIWDLSTGVLKLNMTGHKEAVRSIALSRISPYMFSCSDDHAVRCWDLERNESIREFFGHKSAVHCVAAHPLLDVVLSAGRDKTVRVWDIRTRRAVHTFLGHTDSVMSLISQEIDPQVISGGSDGFIYLWDLAAGKAFTRMTRHKKPVRGLALSPSGSTLVSCGADEVRVWNMPTGEFLCNASTIVPGAKDQEELAYRWSCCAMSSRNTLTVCSDDGNVGVYDWMQPQPSTMTIQRHYAPFQLTKTKAIPGTLPGEGGVNCVTYDISGTRMITAESDKSIKIWRMRDEKSK